ncbi:hypothetical protein ACJIZ3_012437 [Penstemon smallii]|uniref:Uncharacterized protein n=1 Tax=Penstemon smallii TaxID=265156 RepID=A0ABD3UQM2_9LAMI
MGNSLRCCLACVLPCGALDLIRIVHLNGNVEELTGRVTAGEVLKDNPNHVLTKPCGSQGMARRILILSPDSELKRGSIYFLIPSSSIPADKNKKIQKRKINSLKKKCDYTPEITPEITPEKKSANRHRRDRCKSTGGLWKPHLESITEDL